MGRSYYSRAFVANADKLSSLDKKKTKWIFDGFAEENLYQFGQGTETTNYHPKLDTLMELSEMCPNISFFIFVLDEEGELTVYGLRYENEKQLTLKNSCDHYYDIEKAHKAINQLIDEYKLTELDYDFS